MAGLASPADALSLQRKRKQRQALTEAQALISSPDDLQDALLLPCSGRFYAVVADDTVAKIGILTTGSGRTISLPAELAAGIQYGIGFFHKGDLLTGAGAVAFDLYIDTGAGQKFKIASYAG